MYLEFLFNVCAGSAIVAIVPIKCGLPINWVSFAGPSRHSGCAALADGLQQRRLSGSVWREEVGGGDGGRAARASTFHNPLAKLPFN